jgi:pimeloyl-ACP methyl ester carboxylesterase
MSFNPVTIRRGLTALAIGLVLSVLFGVQVAPVGSTPEPKTCTTYQVPVALADGHPEAYQVTGTLCSRGDPAGKTLQVLVHGVTLSHVYWDFPYQPERYSYVDALTAYGYATFNLDRIGIGDSDHPAALAVTVDSNAYVVHQVIQKLRAGTVGGTPFARVVLVGHSLGTLIAVTEAARYGDVDGVVATSFLHVGGSGSLFTFFAGFIPAQLDPKFSNAGLPIGYLTTSAGTRDVFFNPADTDPQVVVLDEAAKETATDGELATYSEWFSPLLAQPIHVPILLAIGQKDGLFCSLLTPCNSASAILRRERLFYSAHGTCLEAYILANAGHNMNYQLNAQDLYAAIGDWADRYVGPGSATPVTCT